MLQQSTNQPTNQPTNQSINQSIIGIIVITRVWSQGFEFGQVGPEFRLRVRFRGCVPSSASIFSRVQCGVWSSGSGFGSGFGWEPEFSLKFRCRVRFRVRVSEFGLQFRFGVWFRVRVGYIMRVVIRMVILVTVAADATIVEVIL